MVAWLVTILVVAQPLGFDEAIARADRSPALSAQASGLELRRELAESVPWVTSNPTLQVQPGARLSPTGATGPELYVGVAQELSLSGAGSSRKTAALREVDADEAALAVRRRAARLTVAQAWLAAWASTGALAAAREELALTQQLTASVVRGAAAGGFTRVDVAITKAYGAEAHLAELSLEGEAFSRSVALARALSTETPGLPEVAATLPVIALKASEHASLVESARSSNRVKAARADEDAARAHSAELEASRGASLQVGALGWREGGGDVAALAKLQLTLPAFERAQRERSVAAAGVAQAEGHVRTALVDERLDRLDALHELEHTAQTRRVLEDALLPAASEAVEGTTRRFIAGEVTAQELVLARRTLVSTKARVIRARADEVFARFRVVVLSQEVSR
jgi:outer membrane protein TolC